MYDLPMTNLPAALAQIDKAIARLAATTSQNGSPVSSPTPARRPTPSASPPRSSGCA